MKNRQTKSNRAQADYFELLVAQFICHKVGVRFAYSKILPLLSNQVLNLPNGKNRLELQNNNLLKLMSKLTRILNFETSQKGKIIDLIWQGRSLLLKTTSDVDAEHLSNKFTRFSIKSISQTGTGTIKNLGMRSLKKYLHIDFNNDYKQMWKELKKYTNKSLMPQDKLKNLILQNNKLFEWAKKNGRKFQIKLNKLCYQAFNNLTQQKKIEFLNYILDAKDEDLYVIIANSKGSVIYRPVEKKINLVHKIIAKKNSNVGYTIYIDNTPAYRVQTNATNGIGISAFCQRVFFVDI